MYDICIVGAGPAGATLARLLDTRYRVLLVDRRRLDAPPAEGEPSKLCGGLLAPAAQQELARQGLGLPGSVLSGPQLFAVRALDLDSKIERLYQRFYTNIDRELFDRWLVSLVPGSVETAFGFRATRIERSEGDSIVRLATSGGGRASVRARLVVAADGANSWVRRQAFGRAPRPAAYAAVQATFASRAAEASFGAFWSRRLTDFYGWTVPKEDHLLVGLAVPTGRRGASASDAFAQFVAMLRESGLALGTEVGRSSAGVSRPMSPAQLSAGDDRVALLGEAAGLMSPSSAEGISYALRSGAYLADALAPGIEGFATRYRLAAAPLAANITGKLAKSAFVHAPGIRPLIMATRIGTLGRAIPARARTADLLGV
ncbi:MAG: FAD-dependent monooxygenase [Coriobacteriales bacterium]|nr:FAD-dependent monooxygenase [Coriobacteriales bacterium]